MWWSLMACNSPSTPTEPTGPDPTTTTTSTTTTGTGDTGQTATTGDTGTVPPYDCVNLPQGPLSYTTINVATTEDFDFDALGSLVYSDWFNFVAVDSYGNFQVVAPGIEDTRGIQILSNGDIAAAYISEGRIGRTDRTTGSTTTMLSGLAGPNALDVGDNDVIYVTETGWFGPNEPRVIEFHPDTGVVKVIATGFRYPNGIALNDAQDALFVADSTAGVYRIRKDLQTGEWLPKEHLFDPPGSESYDGIEVDICGNVYVVQFYNGELYRFDPDTLVSELLIDLNDANQFLWNSIRWGSNRGVWQRDVLYVTDRNRIFAVEVGVPGRRQPVDAMP